MKKNVLRISICIAVSLTILVSLIGCGNKADTSGDANIAGPTVDKNTEVKKEPVKIKYPTYRVGAQDSAPAEKKILDTFKEKFGNEVEVVVEEIPSDQTYVDKIKVLAASSDLPDVVEGKNGIIDLLVKGNLATDLTEYLDADPQWKAEIGDEALKANMRNGKPYSISNGGQLVGYFYNKELFQKAGIKPAETWDEFISNCDKLKAQNITPISMMTGENAWTTNLILASIVGTSNDAGNKFMNEMFPKNFQTPEFVEGLKKIQVMLQKYTTKDALGAGYANAANNFLQGKTAIIANGPWMIPDFSNKDKAPEGFAEKVGVAAYPGSGVFSSYEVGYLICSKDKEHKDAAAKFLKFKTGVFGQQTMLEMNNIMPLTSNVKMSDEYKQKNPLVVELVELGNKAKYKYKFLDTINYANVTDSFQKLYPEIVFNKMTADDMAEKLSETAEKNK